MLASLPKAAEWKLIVHQEEWPLRHEDDGGFLPLLGLLTWLAKACEDSAEGMKKQRGTESDTAQMRAVQALAEVYGRLTHRAPTHSVRERRIYTGQPRTPFTKLVETFFLEFERIPAKRRGYRSACLWAMRQRRRISK